MYRSLKLSSGRLRASLFAVALVTPLAVVSTHAQSPRAVPRGNSQVYNQAYNSQAYNTGYDRGSRVGADDGQRNRDFNYSNKSDYRSADAGYRSEYGDRERWRTNFRLGFENGYRDGYSRYRPNSGNGGYGNGGVYGPYGNGNGNSNGDWRPGTGGPPPWANGRGRGRGGNQTNDYAFQTGFTDGYEAGLDDGRDRRRFDPVGEGRYRSGDHGYRGDYGTRDAYKFRYREAFREGYEDGFGDGQRYDSRTDNRNTRSDGRPTWWPW
jgi:hypothetical protein